MEPRKPWGGHKATRLTRLVLDIKGNVCHWCGGTATTADHYPIARSDGGPDTLANLIPACVPCNCRRGAVLLIARQRAQQAPAPPSRQW